MATHAGGSNGPGSTPNEGASGNPADANVVAFERALENFKGTLKNKEKNNFKLTTVEDLQQAIGELQQKQLSERRLRNMNRLKRFVEAMEQYGKVVDVFCNSTELVIFIWVCAA
jgi:hypothetical protein